MGAKFDGAFTRPVLNALISKTHAMRGKDPNDTTLLPGDTRFLSKMMGVSEATVHYWIKRCPISPVHARSTIRKVCAFLDKPLAIVNDSASSSPAMPKFTDPKYWQNLSHKELAACQAAIVVAISTNEAKRKEKMRKIHIIFAEAKRQIKMLASEAGIEVDMTLSGTLDLFNNKPC